MIMASRMKKVKEAALFPNVCNDKNLENISINCVFGMVISQLDPKKTSVCQCAKLTNVETCQNEILKPQNRNFLLQYEWG